jgi:quinol monooxygenase YgiN
MGQNMILAESVVCLSYFLAKPQYKKALIAELFKLIAPTRSEKGCLAYELLIDNEDPHFLIMSEKFVDEEALAFHERQPYVVAFVEGPMAEMCQKVTWNVAREIQRV